MQEKSNGKRVWHRVDVVRPNVGTQCGEIAILIADTQGYSVVKAFANRQAAERELAQVLEGFRERNADGTLQPLNLSRIRHWVGLSRKRSISPDESIRFEIKSAALFV